MNYSETGSAFQKKIGNAPPPAIDKLVSQLSFIKAHLRYPIDRKKLLPLLSLLAIIPLPVYFFMILERRPESSVPFWALTIGMMLFVPAIVSIFRFRQTFFFVSVKTGKVVTENEQMLISFFQAHQLRFEQHSEAKDLYWIMSRNLFHKSETREVVFFIVDDERILINGHFTDFDLIKPAGAPHHRQMATALKKWIAENKVQKEGIVRR